MNLDNNIDTELDDHDIKDWLPLHFATELYNKLATLKWPMGALSAKEFKR